MDAPPVPRARACRRGVALLITLGMIVLLSGIVVAFLVSVRTDLSASKSYEGVTGARILADSALNLVIAQIREASTQPDQAWISQPGLIRTFDTTGAAVKAYKLYSSDSIVVNGAFDPLATSGDLPPVLGDSDSAYWKNQPALWTDMNEPLADLTRADPFDATGKKPLMNYPIFDGNHINPAGRLSLNKDANADIEGFVVDEYAKRDVSMPVKWLYMLKDGTLAPAKVSGANGDVEVLVPAGREKTAQGETNSIVARVAFWTDDETAKVNVNTASEGTFWDTPVANSQSGVPSRGAYTPNVDLMYERDLAEMQGAQKEFQRYPGHPATTCLSTIFGRQLLLRSDVGGNRAKMVEEINKLIPRITGTEYFQIPTGTSYGATARPSPHDDYSSRAGTKRAGPWVFLGQSSWDENAYPVTPDGDRLYATVDEFLYSPTFGTGRPERAGWQLAPPATRRDTTREMLEMARFFLTASSKAPEQNLFNLPRISVWPVQASDKRRTALDRVTAFCSTVGSKSTAGGKAFYFTRENPNSATDDYTKSAGNRLLVRYLKNLTQRAIPGWDKGAASATTFLAKHEADRDQILAEIIDYIRCTNLIDRTEKQTDPALDPSYTPWFEDPLYRTKRGQVVPLIVDGARGFGRIATISELGLQIVNKSTAENPQNTSLEFTLVPKYFCPLAGFSALANNFRITFKDLKIEVIDTGGSQMAFGTGPQPTLYDIGRISQIDREEFKVGGTIGTESLTEPPDPNGSPPNVGAPKDSKRPTGKITVKYAVDDPYLTIKGTVTAEITAPVADTPVNSTGEPVVQTIRFRFPETKIPVPKSPGQTVIRSLVATGNPGSQPQGLQGDMRLVAARAVVGDTFFAPAPDGKYLKKELSSAHSLRQGFRPGWGGEFGNLVKGMTGYNATIRPDIPGGIDGVLNSLGQTGDWDNGPHFVPDGPYCNKPDEGARRHLHAQRGEFADIEGSPPYIGWFWCPQDAVTQQTTFFSPNRQISSPVMFGSLPTGVLRNRPWQTLLFRPSKYYFPGGTGRPGGAFEHPGSAKYGPPDHLLLDLFWMPVVEPYPVSEPFATAGKINLNQQIVPFTNIRRTTGLRAVMKSVKISALNPAQPDRAVAGGPYIQEYKTCGTVGDRPNNGGGQGVIVRRDIDLDSTIRLIDDRLARNKPFISASEICDIPLVPRDLASHVSANFTATTPISSFDSLLGTFWDKHKLTGDNSLERPYSHIYPRLTTRSNSYTVHVRVQTLRKNGSDPDKFTFKLGRDQVAGEFRGAFLLDRYLDANSATLVDSQGRPADVDQAVALGPYRFRVVSSKQFSQ